MNNIGSPLAYLDAPDFQAFWSPTDAAASPPPCSASAASNSARHAKRGHEG